jgi:hypothetical protein
MHKFSLLLATPLLLLSACTLKIDDEATDSATDSASDSATDSATDSNSSDPTDGTTTDNPDDDNCVPMEDPGTATASGTATGGEDPGGTAGGTAGDSGNEPTAGPECEPLPEAHPSALDFNCACDVPGEHRSCQTPDDLAGTRFCDSGNWGPCIAEPACLPGTYTTCFSCDPNLGTVVSWCVMIDGVPQNNADVDCAP